ncbi:TadE family protein [Aeromicrobium camelliae]|nr:TadE family protein [Aeromicrobium camelliae]
MRTRQLHRDRGTTALEMTALVPLAVLVLFVFIQGAFALYGVTATQTAARQGARAYSLDQNASAAVDSALPSWMRHRVETYGPGHGVRVQADIPVIIPGMSFTIERKAVMP